MVIRIGAEHETTGRANAVTGTALGAIGAKCYPSFIGLKLPMYSPHDRRRHSQPGFLAIGMRNQCRRDKGYRQQYSESCEHAP